MTDSFIVTEDKSTSEGVPNIICQLLQEYDIESAQDIQDALKKLLGGTIKEMMEAEMDEHLVYHKSERSDSDDYRNGYKTKQVNSSYGSMEIEVRKGGYLPMQRISKKTVVILLSTLLGVAAVIFLINVERYNFRTTTESLSREIGGKIDFDCYLFDDLVSNKKRLKGQITMKFPTGTEITYEFMHPPVKVSKDIDIYMVTIVGTDTVYSGETGATVGTGYLFFEENMDTFMLSQTHPHLGNFVGVRDGEITDEVVQKYAEVDAFTRGK